MLLLLLLIIIFLLLQLMVMTAMIWFFCDNQGEKLVLRSASRCVNEPGSYSCQCRRPGFVFFPDVGRCRRQDPCSGGGETETHPCGDRGR